MKNNKTYYICFIAVILISIFSCSVDHEIDPQEEKYVLIIPPGFPYPDIPADNPLTQAKIALGKKLFYDSALSVDSTISCGSCHNAELAFSDDVTISEGVFGRLGFRNSPSLANVVYYPVMLKDGGNPTLETQPYVPLEDHFEMGFNMVLLVNRLNENAEYVAEFKTVFGNAPDPFGITRALAAFERTLISGNSPYDKYTYQGKTTALTTSQKAGMELFFSPELNCSSCHGGFLLTDNSFQNNGYFSDYSADSGRARITLLQEDVGKFRVPTLRNINLTAPYMHDGSVATLEDVIDQYMLGGSGHVNQSELIKSFNLTELEKSDLINFLSALTDEEFISNSDFK